MPGRGQVGRDAESETAGSGTAMRAGGRGPDAGPDRTLGRGRLGAGLGILVVIGLATSFRSVLPADARQLAALAPATEAQPPPTGPTPGGPASVRNPPEPRARRAGRVPSRIRTSPFPRRKSNRNDQTERRAGRRGLSHPGRNPSQLAAVPRSGRSGHLGRDEGPDQVERGNRRGHLVEGPRAAARQQFAGHLGPAACS